VVRAVAPPARRCPYHRPTRGPARCRRCRSTHGRRRLISPHCASSRLTSTS
jgi:hypothetical protein